MKLFSNLSESGLRLERQLRVPLLRRAFLATVALLLIVPGAWTQYPWPSPPAVTGSTLGTNLRNAAAATHMNAGLVRQVAQDWGRRAGWPSYRDENFRLDYANSQRQFFVFRQQFNVMGNLALQLGRPRADNAVAELDAGLNIIAELFTFLENQYNAGTLDQKTIVRTCRALDETMREWERELKKNTSRMGVVW